MEELFEPFERPEEVRVRAPERTAVRSGEADLHTWLTNLIEEAKLREQLEQPYSSMQCAEYAFEGEHPLVCFSGSVDVNNVLRQLLAQSKTAYAIYRVYKEAQYVDPRLLGQWRWLSISSSYNFVAFGLRSNAPVVFANANIYDGLKEAAFVFELDCASRTTFIAVFDREDAVYVLQRPKDATRACSIIYRTLREATLHSSTTASNALLRFLRQR